MCEAPSLAVVQILLPRLANWRYSEADSTAACFLCSYFKTLKYSLINIVLPRTRVYLSHWYLLIWTTITTFNCSPLIYSEEINLLCIELSSLIKLTRPMINLGEDTEKSLVYADSLVMAVSACLSCRCFNDMLLFPLELCREVTGEGVT